MSDAEPKPARDFKDTLNLPKTEFPMKGNLTQLEPTLLRFWEEHRTYAKLIERNAQHPKFVLHDGPPYANGALHAGHALNKILKDIIVKSQNMAGQLCDFIPGWDCHGLPIEQAVEKRLKERKVDKRALSRETFLEHCRQYALEFVEVQQLQFQRMGVMADWGKRYLTLTPDYEAQEIRELAKFAARGSLYRRKRPVYWCLTDQTALAEAEVEYADHQSPSIYVAFEAAESLGKISPRLEGKKVAFAIWTTTPWTLPANLAIAVHPAFEYLFYDLGPRVICVAKDLLPKVLSEISADQLAVRTVNVGGESVESAALVDPTRILAYARGEELNGLKYRHPLYDRTSPVVVGEHVTLEQGTGLVHTAPGHGLEDYELGLANGLDVYNPVKNDGRFDDTVGPELAGKKVFEANPVVIRMLVERGALLNRPADTLTHSYPHCWRCHNPVILRATPQWFISLEKNELRKKALAAIDKIEWIPRWGRERIYGMLENRPDWCISRQRQWGVPIPMALCESCGEAVVSPALMENVARVVEKEGVAAWYRTPLEAFLPPATSCPHCGGSKLRPETDILDVWFDSACSFAAVAEKRPTLAFPVQLYLEGSDQHRGWFHSSLLVGVGTRDRAPYEKCLTHGFVVDGNGEKMSKSKGNVVLPEEIIREYGAEVLRLWVASSDYRDDVRLSKQILKGLVEGYRKIRNTLRYALSNLYDFDPSANAVSAGDLEPLDRWAQSKMNQLVDKVRSAYQQFEFHLVYHSVVDFCAMDLSALYFDILKDRLYTWKADGKPRRSAQTVLYQIARDLLRLLAPIMSFTCEEAWQKLPGQRAESVFLSGAPSGSGVLLESGASTSAAGQIDASALADYEALFKVRGEIQKLLEAARRDKQIGSSLEAKVVISADRGVRELLERHAKELASLFIVSQVALADVPAPSAQPLSGLSGQAKAEVRPADGAKCPRCWTYSEQGGWADGVCAKCTEALS